MSRMGLIPRLSTLLPCSMSLWGADLCGVDLRMVLFYCFYYCCVQSSANSNRFISINQQIFQVLSNDDDFTFVAFAFGENRTGNLSSIQIMVQIVLKWTQIATNLSNLPTPQLYPTCFKTPITSMKSISAPQLAPIDHHHPNNNSQQKTILPYI